MCRNRVIWVIKYPKENDHLFTPKVVVRDKKHRIVFLRLLGTFRSVYRGSSLLRYEVIDEVAFWSFLSH